VYIFGRKGMFRGDEGTVMTLTPNELSRLKLYIKENI